MYIVAFLVLAILLLLLNYSVYIHYALDIRSKSKGDMFIPNDGYRWEGVHITPINPYLLWLYKKFYQDVKPYLKAPLLSYVTFSRLTLTGADRMSCDWCSMVNGLIHLCIDSGAVTNPNFPSYYAKRILAYLKIALVFRDKPNPPTSNIWLQLYKMLEQVELRWCPFKSMVAYYRNANPNYIEPSMEMIYAAGKILSKYDTIECIFCTKVLNKEMDKKYLTAPVSNSMPGLPDSPMINYFLFVLN